MTEIKKMTKGLVWPTTYLYHEILTKYYIFIINEMDSLIERATFKSKYMKRIICMCIIAICHLCAFAQIEIKCADLELASKPLKEVSYVKAIEERIDSKFEACDIKLRNTTLVSTGIHPMISTLFMAFMDHRSVSISPDMIWLLVCQGFSQHVNINNETLRKKIVEFDGKKKLIINTLKISPDFIKGSSKSPWPLSFPIISDSISKYIKPDIYDIFVQSFSTTTPVEKAAFEVALLDAMSGYFEYEYATACGIPIVKIEGTKEDWKKIKNNLQKLRGYKIDNWINSLEPIVQQFINVYDHKIDIAFWINIFKEDFESGGPYITGWIIKFFPYINRDEKLLVSNPFIDKEPEEFGDGLCTNEFPNGLSKASFIWDYNFQNYEMEFLSGFIGIRQDRKTLTLRPEIGWLVREKPVEKTNSNLNKESSNFFDNISPYIWIIYVCIFIFILAIVLLLIIRIRRKKK